MSAADEVIALERRLLDPAVRGDADELERLLHPEFREFGASGTTYDRAAIIAALAAEAEPPSPVGDMTARSVGDAVLLTYGTHDSVRSSLWVREGGRWRVLFHQGTPR